MKAILRKGFTLIEMMLVMVIVSMFIFMGVGYVQQRAVAQRIDITTLQLQQLLNVGLSYYVSNGSWPYSTATQITSGGPSKLRPNYIPTGTMVASPFGGQYGVTSVTTSKPPVSSLFYAYVPITMSTSSVATSYAKIIAGRLPMGYIADSAPSGSNSVPAAVTTCSSTTCYVIAAVNIPGQNLNNASAVNFAGTYNHGGCVPAPTCPVDANGNTMQPQIMLAVTGVSGVNQASNTNVYPISSFTAYVSQSAPSANPANCYNPYWGGSTNAGTNCATTNTTYNDGSIAPNGYWRVCMQVVTMNDDVSNSNGGAYWGNNVKILAFTRCAINNEPAGSTFNVYGN